MSIYDDLKTYGKSITVLYVEDDTEIREQTAIFLNRFFKKVYLAKDGGEALEIFEANEKSIDILISDIKMPKFDGLQLSEKCLKKKKELEIILTTAYGQRELLLKAIDIGVASYIIKPVELHFFASTLIKAIKSIRLYKKEQFYYNSIESIINTQENLLFLIRNETILLTNKAALEYFGYKNTREMYDGGFFITNAFLTEKGYFSSIDKKIALEHLMNNESSEVKVAIKNKDGAKNIFLVKAKKLEEEGDVVISLSNISKMEENLLELEDKVSKDTLTSVYNRLRFDTFLDSEIKRANRYDVPFSLITFDIDSLKNINEAYGHLFGDNIIIQMCEIVKKRVRECDILARWNGAQFIILLPDTQIEQAEILAEDIRESIEKSVFENNSMITCSFGISEYVSKEEAQDILRRVDKRLSEAKKAGKNCIKKDAIERQSNEKSIDSDAIIESLMLARKKEKPIDTHVYYKGLSIHKECLITYVNVVEKLVEVKMQKYQAYAAKINPECFLSSEYLAMPVLANVKKVSLADGKVLLDNFVYQGDSPTQRKLLRVEPKGEVYVSMATASEIVEGVLQDISLSSIKITASSKKDIILGCDVRLSMNLTCDEFDTRFLFKCRAIKLEFYAGVYNMVFAILTQESEKELLTYISKRQLEILRELKEATDK